VPYCVNPAGIPMVGDNQQLMTQQAFVALVQKSFQNWQALPDSYISFRYAGLCTNSPANQSDGVNAVGWGRLSGSTLGVTFPGASQETPFRRGLSGDLIEADIIIDDRTALGLDPATYVSFYLPVIVQHEIGHFLGLGHSTRGCSVMTPSSLQIEFCDDDTEGVRVLYPGPQRAADLRIEGAGCRSDGAYVTFRWSRSPEAEGYVLDLTLDAFFGGWLGIYAGAGPTEGLFLPGLRPGQPHYWRIWTFGGGAGGHVYGPGFVTPLCASGVPVPAGPAGLDVSTACGPDRRAVATFRWLRSLTADGYFVDLSLDPAFGGLVNAWVGGQDSASLTWSGLSPGLTHYFRVYAYNGSGGGHSYALPFQTPSC